MIQSPAKILGVAQNATLEEIEAAYNRLKQESGSDKARIADIVSAYDKLHRQVTARDSGTDGVIPADLIPGLDLSLIADLVEKAADSERRPDASLHSYRPGAISNTKTDSVRSEEGVSLLQKSGTAAEIECLLSMSEIADTAGNHNASEDEEVIAHAVLREEYRGLLRPKKRKSLIGEGEKDIVAVRSVACSRAETMTQVAQLLQNEEEICGQTLQKMRNLHGIKLEEVAARTKVNLVHLQNLEADDYQRMPAPVYFRGFVDSYLKYFGIDNPALVNLFVKRYQASRMTEGPYVRQGPATRN